MARPADEPASPFAAKHSPVDAETRRPLVAKAIARHEAAE
jgi:hypothetical protein